MKSALKACILFLACVFYASVCIAESELVSMFREGLAICKDDPAKGSAMVEASTLQSTSDPMQFADIWEVYIQSDVFKSANNTPKIAMLDVFLECAQKTCQNCKSRSEFNKTWDIQLEIQKIRKSTINEECSIARKALENLELDALIEQRDFLAILLEYADESDKENAEFLQNLSNNIANRIVKYQTRYQELVIGCNDIDWNIFTEQFSKTPVKFEMGDTTLLIMEIRDYILSLQSPEISILMERFPPDKNPLKQGEKLLEKAQKLNRVRYNLWANWVIYNCGDNVAAEDGLSRISPEYLFTPVDVVFQEKQQGLFQKNRDPNGLADLLRRLILEEKAPLSAF